MKVLSIFDFMKDKEEYVHKSGHYSGGEFKNIEFTILNNNGRLRLVVDGKSTEIKNDYDLIDMVEEWCDNHQIRICTYCGKPMEAGYTDDEADFYNCEECFEKDMNERYGAGNWREQNDFDEPNYLGGWYEYFDKKTGKWKPEPSYYTEWN